MKKSTLTNERAASCGIILLFTLFLFIMRNGYFGLAKTRFITFCAVAVTAAALCAVSRMAHRDKMRPAYSKGARLSGAALAAMTVCAAASAILSEYGRSALTGEDGRYRGLITYLAVAAVFFAIKRNYKLRFAEIAVFMASGSVICGFAFAQFLGFDPFGLLSQIELPERNMFISFTGNVNVFASFVCLFAPVSMYVFCKSDGKGRRLTGLAASCLGFFGLFSANSDSGWLGMAAAFAVLGFISLGERKSAVRFYAILASFFVAAAVFGRTVGSMQSARTPTLITSAVTNPRVSLTAAAVSAVLILVAAVVKKDGFFSGIKAAHGALVICAALSLVFAFVYFSFINTSAELGRHRDYLRFSSQWGTDRGYVWRCVIEDFKAQPILRKLFGVGCDCAAPELLSRFGESFANDLGYYFDNAHNEYLQYLLTLGISGLAFYLIFLISSVSVGFAMAEKDALFGAPALAVTAYAVQAAVNTDQIITTPLVFVLCGMMCCASAAGKPPKS